MYQKVANQNELRSKNTSCVCECSKLKSKKERRNFELYKGEIRKYKGELKGNGIDINKYKGLATVFVLIYEFFIRYHSNTFFLIVSLITVINESVSPYTSWGFIVAFGVSFILITGLNIFYDLRRRALSREINTRAVIRFNTKTNLQENIEHRQISVGDVLMIKKNEECPADVVILDCSDSKCLINMQFFDGKMTYATKVPLSTTSIDKASRVKGNFLEFRKILTGRIEYDLPNTNTNTFDGYLKLKKDPKGENISLENVIWRGSVLTYSDWIIGLVVYTGEDTKIHQNTFYQVLKTNLIQNNHNLFTLFTFGHIALYTISCFIFFLTSRSDKETQHGEENIFSFLVIFSPMVPFTFPTIFSFGMLLVKKLWTSRFRAEGDHFFRINDVNSLPNLGKIDCVFVDKTGTITTRKTEIMNILVNNKIFVFSSNAKKLTSSNLNKYSTYSKRIQKENSIVVEEKGSEPLASSKKLDNPVEQGENKDTPDEESLFDLQFPEENVTQKDFDLDSRYNSEYMPSKIPEAKGLFEKALNYEKSMDPNKIDLADPEQIKSFNKDYLMNLNLLNNLFDAKAFNKQVEKDEEKVHNALKSMILCQQTKTLLDKDNKYSYEFLFLEDETVFEFCNRYQFKYERPFKNNTKLEYSISIKDKKSKYEIIGINDFTTSRGRFSIVMRNVKDSEATGSILYVKGYFSSMIETLDINDYDKSYLQELESRELTMGNRTLVYAYRIMSKEETSNYEKRLLKLKTNLSGQNNESIEQLYNEIERNLEMLAIICLEDKIKEDVISTINAMRRAKMKVFMVTGDYYYPAISSAYLSDILSESSQVLRFECSNIEDTKATMRVHLSEVKMGILEMQKTQKQDGVLKNTTSIRERGPRKSLFKGVTFAENVNIDIFDLSFCVVINGSTLDFILKDENLRANLAFMISYCSNMVAYELTALQKAALVCLMKTNLLGNPKILAIGDGYNDLMMMQAADVSIEVAEPGQISLHAADLRMSRWSSVHRVIFVKGFQLLEKLNTILYLMYFKSLLFVTFSFYFNWYSNFQTTIFFPQSFTFFFFFLLTPFSILIKLSHAEQSNSFELTINPLLYLENKIKQQRRNLVFLFESILHPYILSVCLFYLSLYLHAFAVDTLGNPSSLLMISLSCFLVLLILFHTKIVLFTRHNYRITLTIIAILSLSLCIIIFLNGNESLASSTSYLIAWQEIFENPGAILCLIMICIISVQLQFVFSNMIIPKLFPSLFSLNNDHAKGSSMSRYEEIRRLTKMCNSLLKMRPVSSVAKHIFKTAQMDPSVQELLDPSQVDFSETKLQKYSLKFKDKDLERKFEKSDIKRNLNFVRAICMGYLVFTIAAFVREIIKNSDQDQLRQQINQRIAQIIIALTTTPLVWSEYFEKKFKIITLTFTLVLFVWKVFIDYMDPKITLIFSSSALIVGINNFLIGPMALGLFSLTLTVMTLVRNFFYFNAEFFFDDITWSSKKDIKQSIAPTFQIYLLASNLVLIIAYLIYTNYHQYKYEKVRRNEFLAKKNIEIQANKINDVLSILVPKFVKDQMDHGVYSMSEDQGEVAIIFCDICKFEKIVEYEQAGIVEILDNLFRAFDQMCVQHGIQKIETVGKTYMAASGISACEIGLPANILHIEKTKRAVDLALDMLEFAENQTWGQDGYPLVIKIGIHIGRVIAGVIGHHKPQFSLIGDTVNTTSRVCSTGKEGYLTVSVDAYEKIKLHKLYFKKAEVYAKGKGNMDTYQVAKRPLEEKLPQIVRKPERSRGKGVFANRLQNIRNRANEGGFKKKTFIAPSVTNNVNTPKMKLPQNANRLEASPSNKISKIQSKELIPNNSLNIDLMRRKSTKNQENNVKNIPADRSPQGEQRKIEMNLLKVFTKETEQGWNFLKRLSQQKKPSIIPAEAEQPRAKEEILQPINHSKDSSLNQKVKSSDMADSSNKIEVGKDAEDDDWENDLENEEIKKQMLKPSKFFLLFRKNDNEGEIIRDFFHELVDNNESDMKFYILFLMSIYLAKTSFVIIIREYITYGLFIIFYRGLFNISLILLYFLKHWLIKKNAYKAVVCLIFSYGIATTLILTYNHKISKFDALEVTEMCLIFFIFTMMSGIFFFEKFALCLGMLVLWLIVYRAIDRITYDNLYNILLFSFFCLMNSFIRLKSHVKNFNSLRVRETKKKQQNTLLKHLVPQHVLYKFLLNPNKKQDLTDMLSSATILFADIAGFTKYSSSVSPEQVVTMLKDLFTEFDRRCLRHGVYKVYTIGDCYVVLGVLDAYKRDPAEEAKNVVQMGFSMIEIIKIVRKRINFYDLDMRIGIHTGEIIGGIIGTDIVRYDIYGKDVMIANKMESNGVEGKVMVSEDTKSILEKRYPGDFSFEKHKTVELPGDRTKDGYLITIENSSMSYMEKSYMEEIDN